MADEVADETADVAGDTADDVAAAKRALRERILARRRARPAAEIATAADAIAARELANTAIARQPLVALYVSTGTEPGTLPLLAALRERGVRTLLPVLRDDLDLDWAEYTGALVGGARGTLEPDSPRLGPDAIAEAAWVLVPGLAVDHRGIRLGRGGGSYDRALRRLGASARPRVVLYDDEVLIDPIPAASHDIAVRGALTPSASFVFGMTPC